MLFDLDGTISDSAQGILAALRHAFEVTGFPPMSPETEREILGPPFYESLPPILGGSERLGEVIAAYRAHYGNTENGGGMFDTARLTPGSPSCSPNLHGDARVTGGGDEQARGLRPADRRAPSGFLDALLRDGHHRRRTRWMGRWVPRHSSSGWCSSVSATPIRADVVMIGDRSHDVLGAREHGIDSDRDHLGIRDIPGRSTRLNRAGSAPPWPEVAEVIGLPKGG